MTEEEYFIKNYPDVCYNGKPLSPYWDLFQDGVEYGERQSEKKVEEPEIERLRESNSYMFDTIALKSQQIEKLEKENAELKNKLTEKVTLESLDVVSAKMNDLEKENSELKRNKKTVVHLADCLEEKMKERIEELETRCTELFLQNNEFAEHLTKAKEIIKELARVAYADFTDGDYSNELSKVLEQAEQFIKEIEK